MWLLCANTEAASFLSAAYKNLKGILIAWGMWGLVRPNGVAVASCERSSRLMLDFDSRSQSFTYRTGQCGVSVGHRMPIFKREPLRKQRVQARGGFTKF